MKKRVGWIDIARAIAMICVIIGHSLFQYTGEPIGRYIYAFHMPIFFLLSGYLYHERDYVSELKNTLNGFMLPYYATGLLMLGLFPLTLRGLPFMQSMYSSYQVLLSSIFYGTGTNPNIPFSASIGSVGAIWFLPALGIATMIFNYIIRSTKELKQKNVVRLSAVVFLAIIGKSIASFWLLPLSLNAATFSLTFMYVGYLMKKTNFLSNLKIRDVMIGLILWIITAQTQLFSMVSVGAQDTLMAIGGGIGGSIVVMYVSQFLEEYFQSSNVLEYIGRNSIIVLCFHILDLNFSGIPTLIMQSNFSTNPIVKVISVIGYRLIIPFLACYLVPKIPMLRSFFLNKKYPFYLDNLRSIKVK